VTIPKPDGGERELGIPTVTDRLIQQALLQVLQPILDLTFSEHSHGFRPGHRAHLNSEIMSHGVVQERYQGTPRGGPLSPLLANVLLDEVDKELERRGHCFVRYADDCNVYVRSQKAGERVMALLRRCYAKLKLRINESKSAVASVVGRKFLGYSFWFKQGAAKCKVSSKALARFKQRIRQTDPTLGRSQYGGGH
jgi:retron-type reverse transcriptase